MQSKTKMKTNQGWFLLQAKVTIGVCCHCWSVRISLTLVNGKTNVVEPPLAMIHSYTYF